MYFNCLVLLKAFLCLSGTEPLDSVSSLKCKRCKRLGGLWVGLDETLVV